MSWKRWMTGTASTMMAAFLLVGCAERAELESEPTPLEPGREVEVEQPVGENVEDVAITSKVKSALIASPQVGALSIGVDTSRNIVTLTGTVETQAQKREAEQIAKDIEGVQAVVNQIVVRPGAATE